MSKDAGIRARAVAMLLKGVPADRVARETGASRRSVFRWAEQARSEKSAQREQVSSTAQEEPVEIAGIQDHQVEAVLARVVELAQIQLLDPQCTSIDRQRARNDIMALEERRRKLALAGTAKADRFDFGQLTREEVETLLPLLEKARVA